MEDHSKDRDEHPGQQAPHLGSDHHEKSQIEAAARGSQDVDSADLNPAVSPALGEIGPTGVHPERLDDNGEPVDGAVAVDGRDRIVNAGSDPDGDLQRTGGSPNDPDGGHELLGGEWRGPDPDPINEMVPGGQGAEAPPYGKPVPERVAAAAAQPGIGTLKGSTPAPAVDDHDAQDHPGAAIEVRHEGIIRMESTESTKAT